MDRWQSGRVTATGAGRVNRSAALADHLRALAERVEAGEVPPMAAARLAASVEQAAAYAARDRALRLAARLIDPDGRPGRQAKRLAEAVRAFEVRAWPRIAAGYRQPHNSVEAALAEAFRTARVPRTSRQLVELIR